MGRRSLHWLCAQYAFGGKLCGLAEAESGFHGYGGAAISKRGVDRRSSAGAGDRARRHAKFLRRTGRTADGGQAVYGGGRCRQAQGGGVELRVVAETLWRRRISHWAVHLDGWRAGDGCGYHAARLFLPDRKTMYWEPASFTAADLNPDRHFLHVVARLKPGVALERAKGDMDALAKRLQQQYPDHNTNIGAVVGGQ